MNVFDVVGKDGARHFYLSPLTPEDVRTIGSLPGEGIMGELLNGERPAADAKLDPAQFRPNPVFLTFLSGVFAQYGHQAPGFAAAAQAQQSGYIYIIDARTATPRGQVPPEDILGGIEISNGAPVRYHASGSYRTLTERGVMRLHPWMHTKLIEELRKLAR
ncbi:hypothetical protein BH11MYX1_BH11MYX1_48750 [soil metagenome]